MTKKIVVYESMKEYVNDSSITPNNKEIVSYYESNPDQMMKYGDYYLRGALECDSRNLDDIVYIKAIRRKATFGSCIDY